ncbi:tRNA dimethylallyltransferase, mitochondrial [Diplodia intermedia]|uniref:tRNA dimethylallyltransferase n=1 Tax=Diplodia intermedia TaxID=856260 RepID=A0ABR3TDV1_9PEZI
MARCQPQKPVLAVIGATGTGKSQLAVELACRFNGEIINSDAMQLYEGLPVITNKITQEEMKGVPHHLLGTITHDEDTWTVTKFVQKALGVIDDIHSRGKLPIIAGGTHYYIQALLFKDSLTGSDAQQPEDQPKPPEDGYDNNSNEDYPILDEPTEAILAKLREVDPVMADRWHPNDRRKIQRSLQIWLKTGKTASQTYEEQRKQKQQEPATTTTTTSTTQRFPALLFWVHAAASPLRARLDARVEKMLANGLLAEADSLDRFLQQRAACGQPVDKTRGICVSIGYKEFEAYRRRLALLTNENDNCNNDDEELARLRAQAVERVQAGTRRYAKSQLQWIRIKLMNALAGAGATRRLYLLDGSDAARWGETVEAPALGLAARFLAGEQESLPDPRSLSDAAAEMLTPKREYDLSERRDMWRRRACETCGVVAVTEADWDKHVRSRGHWNRAKKRRQREQAAAAAAAGGGAGRPEKHEAGDVGSEPQTAAPEGNDVEATMAAFDELVGDRK